jgi:hypothetical protein
MDASARHHNFSSFKNNQLFPVCGTVKRISLILTFVDGEFSSKMGTQVKYGR